MIHSMQRRLRRRLRRGGTADLLRQERVALLLQLVERFVHDLGLLIAGRPTDLDAYVAAPVRDRIEDALRPLEGGRRCVHPEFGEYAQVRIDGDLLDTAAPVRSVVEFDDRSSRLDEDGATLARRRRRVRLLLVFDPGITTIVDHRVEVG